jgi:hypothetical protein
VFDSGNPTTPLGDFARREAKIVARAVDLYQQRSVEEPSDGWKRYVKSGYKRSSSIFRKLSLACPELAREMHWILRIRCGAMISWHHAKKHCNAAIKTAAKGCGCCREDNIADSLDHFFFRCDPTLEAADAVHINGSLTTHPLKAARQAVNLQKTANLLARAVVDFHFSFGPDKRKLKQLDFSKIAKFTNPELSRLLLGGSGLTVSVDGITYVIHKGLSDLAGWDPRPSDGDMHAAEQERVKSYLRALSELEKLPNDTELTTRSKRTRFLKRYRFLEGGLRLISEFLRHAVKVRNSQFWDGAFSSSQRPPPA